MEHFNGLLKEKLQALGGDKPMETMGILSATCTASLEQTATEYRPVTARLGGRRVAVNALKVITGLRQPQDLPQVQLGALLLPTREALAEGQMKTWTWP